MAAHVHQPHYVAATGWLGALLNTDLNTHARSCTHCKPASTSRFGAVTGRSGSSASSGQHAGEPMQGGCSHSARGTNQWGTGYKDLAQLAATNG